MLMKFGLSSFEYRVFSRLAMFLRKLTYLEEDSCNLMDQLKLKLDTRYNTRSSERFIVPKMHNHYGDASFAYFYTRFANLILSDNVSHNSYEIEVLTKSNIDLKFTKFQSNFDMLNLKFEVTGHNTYS